MIDCEPQASPEDASFPARWTTGWGPMWRSRPPADPRERQGKGSIAGVATGPGGGDRPVRSHRRLRLSTRSRRSDRRHPRDRRSGHRRKEVGSHPFGSGPVIGRGLDPLPKVYELLRDAAGKAGIGFGWRRWGTRPIPMPTLFKFPGPASRLGSSRSRCAAYIRRSRWSTWPTSRRRWNSWSPTSSRASQWYGPLAEPFFPYGIVQKHPGPIGATSAMNPV